MPWKLTVTWFATFRRITCWLIPAKDTPTGGKCGLDSSIPSVARSSLNTEISARTYAVKLNQREMSVPVKLCGAVTGQNVDWVVD